MPARVPKPTENLILLPPGFDRVVLLIADSEQRPTRSLAQSLHSGGYHVAVTASGREALQIIQNQHPDLILIGEHLRDGAGMALCQHLKAEEGPEFLPVIYMPSREPSPPAIPLPDYAPDATLCKPITPAALQNWLWTLLRIKQQFDRRLQQYTSGARTLEMLKSDIISNVSHELGTPLLQVKSAVSLLAEDIIDSGAREQRLIADMATQAISRLESIVNNIRQLARTHNIELGPVSCSEAADLAIRSLERIMTTRRIRDRIEKRILPAVPPIMGDKRALAHVLQLLLDNALKFSPVDSQVHILAEQISDREVWVAVRDFGIGIAPQEHVRIFEAFYQVNGGAARPYGGTGTGLTLAMLLARGMNSTIVLESTPGEGSTFSLILPIARLDVPY
ncbi:MAG: hybrid sensor histidine kinase/response regulator [Chloroflexi bacterium]|nr:hybrid sensor histidine kinase/response regulator [Chloroflexota bacterium]